MQFLACAYIRQNTTTILAKYLPICLFVPEVVIFLSFIIFYSAMISAMGEIVWELFGVNKILTGVLMALLVCTLTIMGAENIIAF